MYVETELMPYHVVLDTEPHRKKLEMWKWCKSRWNPSRLKSDIWKYTSTECGHVFKFKHEHDRTLFLLQWGVND